MSQMNRRDFLAASVAVVGAGALASRAGAQEANTARTVLGTGSDRYECIHDWLVPPAGMAFGDTHGLAQDRGGRIYLAHTVGAGSTSANGVVVYGADGKILSSWGPQFAGGAHGLDLRDEGGTEVLYHCDTRRRCVEKTALDGTVMWSRACPMESGVYDSPEAWCPTNVAFLPDGDLLVGDGYGKSFIHRYGADGSWKSIFARPGSAKGEVSCPHGLWVDPRGTTPQLVVADRGNRRIQVFDLDGKHVSFQNDGVRLPCDMKFREGQMLVPDLESVVSIYDEEGKPVVHLGDGHPSALRGATRDKFVPGKFVHPHDAIWLASGDILVAEWVPIGRVTLLRKLA